MQLPWSDCILTKYKSTTAVLDLFLDPSVPLSTSTIYDAHRDILGVLAGRKIPEVSIFIT